MIKKLYVFGLLLFSIPAMAAQVTLTKDNTLVMNAVFDSDTVANLIKKAKDLDARTPSGDPIYLVINSPGGSIEAGLELIENLSSLQRPVHTLSLFSASMGFQTVQGLGDRLITQYGTLMSHKAKGAFKGEFPGQLDSRYSYYLKRVFRMDKHTVKRTKGKHTLQSYQNLIENEYWCDGEDCIAEGLADRVIKAACDKSLSGTHKEVLFQDLFMGNAVEATAEYDNCPLNTGALKYNIEVNGKPLFKEDAPKEEKKATSPKDAWAQFNSAYQDYSSKSIAEQLPAIPVDVLTELFKRVQSRIEKIENKDVIKSY